MHSHDDVGMSFPQTPAELLAEMASLYKYNMSDFEAMLWAAQVFECYPPEAVMRALIAHMESGTNDANFMPKYGAIKARLEPVRGFKEIESAVRITGPYAVPDIKDPVVLAAINELGGWARVCSEMPDPTVRPIDFDRYVKRVEAALQAARNQTHVQAINPPPLKAIGGAAPTPDTPALPLKAPLALAAPAKREDANAQASTSVDLTSRPLRASIWSTPKS